MNPEDGGGGGGEEREEAGGGGGGGWSTGRRKSMARRCFYHRLLVFDGCSELSLFVLPLLMSILLINLKSVASSTVSSPSSSSSSSSRGINRGAKEYCQSETFTANCRHNERIVINRAEYGRMRTGRCVEAKLGPVSMLGESDYIGCKADVLSIADSMCSGRRTCEIRVPNIEMDKTEPCYKELKTYLEIDHTCVTVAVGESQFCGGIHHQIQLVADEGYLSSDVSYSMNCGSSTTPWVIDALSGQRVNVTLLDFTYWRSFGQSSRTESRTPGDVYGGMNSCIPLGYIVERNAAINQTICGGREREELVYSSQKNSVEIYFLPEKNEGKGPKFMIYYKTVGCPDLKPPSSAWYKRDGDTAVVGCEDTDKTWHLVCRNNRWNGVVGNCSAFRGFLSPLPIRGNFSLSNGLSIAVVMGIAVLIAIIILVSGLIYVTVIRKQSKEQIVGHQLMLPNRSASAEEVYKSNYRVIRLDDGSQAFSQRQISREVAIGEAGLQTTDAGNDYAHIWETPLPEPIGAASSGDAIDSRGAYSSTPRQARSPRAPEKPEAECEGDGCDAPTTRVSISTNRSNDKCECDTSSSAAEVVGPISVSRYFLLEKRSAV